MLNPAISPIPPSSMFRADGFSVADIAASSTSAQRHYKQLSSRGARGNRQVDGTLITAERGNRKQAVVCV